MGTPQRKLYQTFWLHGSFDWLRLRDDPEQSDHHGQDQRAGCHHAGTRQPRSLSGGSVAASPVNIFHIDFTQVRCHTECPLPTPFSGGFPVKRSTKRCNSVRLSEPLNHRLSQYALAASAAGVGVLALAQPAEARIVYTPAHRYIRLNHPLGIDLNRDGIVDFYVLGLRANFQAVASAFSLHFSK